MHVKYELINKIVRYLIVVSVRNFKRSVLFFNERFVSFEENKLFFRLLTESFVTFQKLPFVNGTLPRQRHNKLSCFSLQHTFAHPPHQYATHLPQDLLRIFPNKSCGTLSINTQPILFRKTNSELMCDMQNTATRKLSHGNPFLSTVTYIKCTVINVRNCSCIFLQTDPSSFTER